MKNSRFMRGISAFLAFALVLESVAFAVPTQRDEHERNSLRRLEEEVQFSSVRHIFSRHLPDHEQPSEAELAFRQRDLAIWLQFQTQGEPLKRAMFRLLGQRLASTLHHPARVDALWGAGTAARQSNQNRGPYQTPLYNETEGHAIDTQAEQLAATAQVQSQYARDGKPIISRFFASFKRNVAGLVFASTVLSFLGTAVHTSYREYSHYSQHTYYDSRDWTDNVPGEILYEGPNLASFDGAPLWAQASLTEIKETILTSADYVAYAQLVTQHQYLEDTVNNISHEYILRADAGEFELDDGRRGHQLYDIMKPDPLVRELWRQHQELRYEMIRTRDRLEAHLKVELDKLDGLNSAVYLQYLLLLSLSIFGFVSFGRFAYIATSSIVDRHKAKALAKSMLEALEFGYREGCEQLGIAHDQTISRALRAGTMDLSLATLPMAAASSAACEELLKSQAVQQAVPANRVRVEAAAAESAPATISTQTQEHEVAVEVEALAER